MTVYRVRSGDTMSKIAHHFNVSLQVLSDANPHVENINTIFPGQLLNIPDGNERTDLILPPPVSEVEPAWFAVAHREMETGVDEVPGPGSNPRILEYHQATSLKATEDAVDWCSAFVNWCFLQVGIQGTNSAAARSWANWGEKLDQPRPGCVVVFRRRTSTWKGHVGFYFGPAPNGRIYVLGGNQGNQVNITSYNPDGFLILLGYRWPTT